MSHFAYTAVDASGRTIRGVEQSADAQSLQQQLVHQGLLLIHAKAVSVRKRQTRLSTHALLALTRPIASFLEAGMPLVQALFAATGTVPAKVANRLSAIRTEVEQGRSLAQTLESQAGAFPSFYIAVIRAGEASGDLTGAFARLVVQLETASALRARLVTALLYPCIILAVGSIASAILLLGVLPRLTALLIESGAAIPPLTRALLEIASFSRNNWWACMAGLCLLIAALLRTMRYPRVRLLTIRLTLRLPALGELYQQAAAVRFGSQMHTLLSAGTPLLVALDVMLGTTTSELLKRELDSAQQKIKAGSSLHAALQNCSCFPLALSQIIASGEGAGKLAESFGRAANFFQAQLERSLTRAVTLVEPALIVAFGVLVGAVALSLIQAIYSVNAGAFK